MWEVHYSQEAATYLEDNGTLITTLFFAIESLAASNGLPVDENFQAIDGLIYWLVHDHTVVYRRMKSTKTVRVLFIKPE